MVVIIIVRVPVWGSAASGCLLDGVCVCGGVSCGNQFVKNGMLIRCIYQASGHNGENKRYFPIPIYALFSLFFLVKSIYLLVIICWPNTNQINGEGITVIFIYVRLDI